MRCALALFAFSALALAPSARAADCPTSEFVVYFELDGVSLNATAQEAIDAATAARGDCEIDEVLVVSHTDTSGSAQYNLGLSERRAMSVRDALVARGLSENEIGAIARGESDLARATRDGVPDALNRRVAVTIEYVGVSGYVRARVVSETATAFHLIRSDLWTRLAGTDELRLAALITHPEFGPYRVGDPQRMRIERQYRIFPVCDNRVRLETGIAPVVSSQDDIEVRCQ